jgi:hypothetical protein
MDDEENLLPQPGIEPQFFALTRNQLLMNLGRIQYCDLSYEFDFIVL